MILRTDLIAVYPDFSDVSEDTFNFYAGLCTKVVNESAFGEYYVEGCTLYIAHCLEVSRTDNAGRGQVTSERVGDYSMSYSASVNDYDQTQYGKQFKAIRKLAVGLRVLS